MPAARVGDMTGHGTPLAPEPVAHGVQPHVGGTVAAGSATVLIGGLPAARQTDTLVEAGGPNPIAAGAPTVLIG